MSEQETAPEAPEAEPEVASEDEPKTYTEEYVKQLRGEAAQYRTRLREVEGKVKEFEEANQSELEKLTGRLSAEQKRADEAAAKLLRFEVASDKDVPSKLVKFLQGDSREELEASAVELLELTKAPDSSPSFDGGPRVPAEEPKTPVEAHNDVLLAITGRSNNV